MASITSQNAAQAIVKLVASRALPALEPNFIMGGLVNRNFDSDLAAQGDVINVPIPGIMVANNIAEGGSVKTDNPNLGNAQIVLNKHAEKSFKIPDVTKVLAFPGLLDAYMTPAVNAVATMMESDLLALYQLLDANTAVGTGAAGLGSEATIDSAERTLFSAYVPEGLKKYLVVGASAYSDIRQLGRFTEANKIGNGDAIRTGFVGTIKGFDIFRTQLAPTVSTTTYNLAFASDAFALVTRPLPTPVNGTGAIAEYVNKAGYGMRVIMSYDPNTLSQQFTVDVLYGCGVLRNVYGVQVLS